jgi:ABC-type oligopeptide transport system substrate-binding subunit
VANLLYDIKGARLFHQGEVSDPGSVGVRAEDEVTLAVELTQPTGYFLHLLAHTCTVPVPRHIVETHGEAWTEAGNIVTNGPFRLETWRRGESMVLIRNPEYHGWLLGNVQRVELLWIKAGSPAKLASYEADRLDFLDIRDLGPHQNHRVWQRYAGEFLTPPPHSVALLAFDASRPPFDDARVRRAFVMAADRETLADVILRGRMFPATGGFLPPAMPAHSARIGLPYDPERARQLLREAGYLKEDGHRFPPVDWLTPSSPSVLAIDRYLQAQWRENLGIDLTWEALDWAELVTRRQKQPPQLFDMALSADYPDPNSLLGVGVVQRYTGWQSEAYDGLIEEARRKMDQDLRMKLYRQADRLLMEEAVIMPLLYWSARLLVKPWVSNLPVSATGRPLWKDVIIEPH